MLFRFTFPRGLFYNETTKDSLIDSDEIMVIGANIAVILLIFVSRYFIYVGHRICGWVGH